MALTDIINKINTPINPPEVTKTSDGNFKLGKISFTSLISLITPYVKNFLLASYNTDKLLSQAIKESTTLLNRKGRVEIDGTVINFYPIADGPWLKVKEQFDKKIQIATKNVERLQEVINVLQKLLNIVNTTLTAYQLYLKLQQLKYKTKSTISSTELLAPTPTKPVLATFFFEPSTDPTEPPINTLQTNLEKMGFVNKLPETEDINIDDITSFISTISSLLTTLNSLLTKTKIKLSQARFNIISNQSDYQNTKEELISSFNNVEVPLTLEETITGSNGIKYTIKVVALKDNFNKAVAYDSLSGLLITQTAPSIIKTPYELIQELKQILS